MSLFLTLSLLLIPGAEAGRRSKKPAPQTLSEAGPALMVGALGSSEAYDELEEICDDIGHRLSGSKQLEEAIEWAAAKMAEDGLITRTEDVMVPHWTRGTEHAEMLLPRPQPLEILTLGMSVGGKVEADVVVVNDFDHLDALGEQVRGKIVLYDVPFTGYGPTVQYRTRGPSRAAAYGAVATLVRSVSPTSLSTPHTGTLRYDEEQPKIPAAAVTIEAATQIHRMVDAGRTVRIKLELGAENHGEAPSANVIGEVTGRESPDEVVVLGCHLDSWDVGQGAQDDAAGCVIAMEAAALINQLPVRPKRTVRAVLYTNEENGVAGGKAYAKAHADERHVALMESDSGAGQPLGFSIDAGRGLEGEAKEAAQQATLEQLAPVAELLNAVGASELTVGYAGTDVGPTIEAQETLGLGLRHDMTGYWPIHHTKADTIDKIDPMILRKNVAAYAVMAWYLAERD